AVSERVPNASIGQAMGRERRAARETCSALSTLGREAEGRWRDFAEATVGTVYAPRPPRRRGGPTGRAAPWRQRSRCSLRPAVLLAAARSRVPRPRTPGPRPRRLQPPTSRRARLHRRPSLG